MNERKLQLCAVGETFARSSHVSSWTQYEFFEGVAFLSVLSMRSLRECIFLPLFRAERKSALQFSLSCGMKHRCASFSITGCYTSFVSVRNVFDVRIAFLSDFLRGQQSSRSGVPRKLEMHPAGASSTQRRYTLKNAPRLTCNSVFQMQILGIVKSFIIRRPAENL